MAGVTLTGPQLQQLWISNGGRPSAAPMAAAIALAESSGRQDATNHNTDGSTDRGYWQINSIHGAQSTFDPNANARSAIAISNNGASWGPWSTFNNGAFKAFLTGRQTAPVSGLADTPLNRALTAGAGSGPAGSDLFGAHHSELLYGTVWVGALTLAVFLLYLGVNRTTHGAASRTVHHAARAGALAAA